MKLESGKFYFIRKEYFNLFKDFDLMNNKENGNKRPCYFCFRDSEDDKVIWFVPISSKLEKYRKIYEYKRAKIGRVHNFVFGKVLGKETVFLIQNMFPATEKYVDEKYVNKSGDVKISKALSKEIITKATNVIRMSKQGINITFNDINKMKKILLEN